MSLDAFIGVTGAIKKVAETVQALRAAGTKPEIELLYAQLLGQVASAEKRAFDAQQVASQLHEQNVVLKEGIATLRKENHQLRHFHLEKERYELKALGDDALVYVLRDDAEPAEAAHCLCVRCFNEAKHSILQFAGHEGALRVLACQTCDVRVLFPDKSRTRGAIRVPRRHSGPGLA